MCCSKISKDIKEQEAKGLLSSLRIKASLSKILQQVLFCFNTIKQVNARHKMNEIVSKFLLAGGKCIPKTHLSQAGFTYSACGPFTKNKKKQQ